MARFEKQGRITIDDKFNVYGKTAYVGEIKCNPISSRFAYYVESDVSSLNFCSETLRQIADKIDELNRSI